MNNKPTTLELKLYDAIDRIFDDLYGDGYPTKPTQEKAERAMGRFIRQYGARHEGKFIDDPMGHLMDNIKELVE